MKLFALIFLALAVYGFVTDHNGGAILAMLMSGFMLYGERQLRKRDIEYYTDPRSAREPKDADTLKLLEEQGSEGGRSEF
jgi:hypothetical protein